MDAIGKVWCLVAGGCFWVLGFAPLWVWVVLLVWWVWVVGLLRFSGFVWVLFGLGGFVMICGFDGWRLPCFT